MTFLFRLAASLISIYTLLILVRVLLSWFQSPYSLGKPGEILYRVTEPYLRWFERFPFLRLGNINFSPVAGLVVLSVFGTILSRLAEAGTISLGMILAVLVLSLWSVFSFLLLALFLLSVIRFIGIQARINPASQIWQTMDYILNPVLLPVTRFVLGGRPTSYINGLLLGAGVFLGGWALGGVVMSLVANLLKQLPV